MAEGTKLLLVFKAQSSNSNVTFSFNYAKPSVTTAQVKNLMNTMIANKEIFTYPPVEKVSAKTVTVSETVYDLSA